MAVCSEYDITRLYHASFEHYVLADSVVDVKYALDSLLFAELADNLLVCGNLLRVSGSLKVKESVLMLSEISESYVTNYGKMLTDGNYTQRELDAIAFGYNNIMKKSSASVAGLKDIINPTGMSMTDKERLDLIERVYREMRHYRTLVNYYTRKNLRVSYLRAREKGETEQVLKLYGEDERYW